MSAQWVGPSQKSDGEVRREPLVCFCLSLSRLIDQWAVESSRVDEVAIVHRLGSVDRSGAGDPALVTAVSPLQRFHFDEHAWRDLSIAHSMRQAVEVLDLNHGHRPDNAHGVPLRLGVALSRAAGSAEAFVAYADQALYHAKAEGRNCTHLFASDPESTSTIAA